MANNFEAIDFGRLYAVQRAASTHKTKDKVSWDAKAQSMNQKIHQGFYNDMIEKSIACTKEDTFLDIGCGPGTFSLRFAPLVKEVFAFDFSAKMIEILEENKKKKGITNITTMTHDMEESWESIPMCDIVLASRCLEVDDIADVLQKLDAHAKKAVYLTFKVGKSYLDEKLLKAMGREVIPKPDYIYLLNVLYNMGINAQLQFIFPQKEESCSTVLNEQEYLQAISWSLDGINELEEQKASAFYKKCIQDGIAPPLRDSRWALISWKK